MVKASNDDPTPNTHPGRGIVERPSQSASPSASSRPPGVTPAFATTDAAAHDGDAAAHPLRRRPPRRPIAREERSLPRCRSIRPARPSARSPRSSRTARRVTLTAEHGAMRVTFLDDRTFRLEADPSGELHRPGEHPAGRPGAHRRHRRRRRQLRRRRRTVADGDPITISHGRRVDRRSTAPPARSSASAPTARPSGRSRRPSRSAPPPPPSTSRRSTASSSSAAACRTAARCTPARPSTSPATSTGTTTATRTRCRTTCRRTATGCSATPSRAAATTSPGTRTTHEERRFDAYYFVGDYKASLESYTQLTGRPMMPPVYALEYGDADCYNRSNPGYSSLGLRRPAEHEAAHAAGAEHREAVRRARHARRLDARERRLRLRVPAAARDRRRDRRPDRPRDGPLDAALARPNQEFEVGEAGVRLRKLDVAWVGSGYRQALTGCEAAHGGIEQYSDARGTSLMVEGWAGAAALRHAVDGRPHGQPRRRALAGPGAHRRRQLGPRVHDGRRRRHLRRLAPRATCATCSGRRSHPRSTR